MALNWPSKSPNELLDYQINWSAELVSDTITSSAWAISDASLIEDHATNAPQTATIWLKSGTPNNQYTVTNTIMTAGGRIFVQAVNIKIVTPTS